MRKLRLLTVMVACCTMQGCGVAALVAAASWAGKNSENTKLENRQMNLARERAVLDAKLQYQQINLSREKAGLRPITWEEFRRGKSAASGPTRSALVPDDG